MFQQTFLKEHFSVEEKQLHTKTLYLILVLGEKPIFPSKLFKK
jgi:hypothetical protein